MIFDFNWGLGGVLLPLLVFLAVSSLRILREYQRGVVFRTDEGALQVRTTGNQGSGVLSSMVQANGLIVLHQLGSHGPTYFERYPADSASAEAMRSSTGFGSS